MGTGASNVCGAEPVGVEPVGVETGAVDSGAVATGTPDTGVVVAETSDWRVVETGLLDGDELHANDPTNGRTRMGRTLHVFSNEVLTAYSFSVRTTILALPRKPGNPYPCGFLVTLLWGSTVTSSGSSK